MDAPLDAQAEFDEFYRSTADRSVRYAYGMCADLGTAQDVTQEAYMRAWQRWRQIREYDHPEPWIRVVITRLCTDRWRRRGSYARALRSVGAPPAVAPPSEDTVLLTAALKRISVPQRQVIVLHYLMDLSVADIAVEIGASLGTVKSRLARGREALAAVLGVPAGKEQPDAV